MGAAGWEGGGKQRVLTRILRNQNDHFSNSAKRGGDRQCGVLVWIALSNVHADVVKEGEVGKEPILKWVRVYPGSRTVLGATA